MTATQDIRRALEQRLNSGSYTGITNGTDIAWENTTFNPTGKSAWIRPRFTITEIIPATADATQIERYTGIFYVDAFTKPNIGGTAVMDDLADDIKAQFPKGTQISQNSRTINIRFSERGGIIHDEAWIYVPLTFTWYSYISI